MSRTQGAQRGRTIEIEDQLQKIEPRRTATRKRLLLTVANFRAHAALFAPLLSPTLS
jgi:hypothetical protein